MVYRISGSMLLGPLGGFWPRGGPDHGQTRQARQLCGNRTDTAGSANYHHALSCVLIGQTWDASAFQRFGWNVLLPLMRPLFPDFSTPDTAAKRLAHLMLDPALENTTGKYFESMHERASSQESYDQHKAAELLETSAALAKLQPSEAILQVGSNLDAANV
jgi:hypothetical protein